VPELFVLHGAPPGACQRTLPKRAAASLARSRAAPLSRPCPAPPQNGEIVEKVEGPKIPLLSMHMNSHAVKVA